MIADQLTRTAQYAGLAPRLHTALVWLRTTDLAALPLGRLDLDGDALFALVQEYDTRPEAEALWEAHQTYIDVQCVVTGAERMGYMPYEALTVTVPYDPEKDVLFGTGTGSFVDAPAGTCFVLWPGDAHMPGLQRDGVASPVRKIVLKVAVDE